MKIDENGLKNLKAAERGKFVKEIIFRIQLSMKIKAERKIKIH